MEFSRPAGFDAIRAACLVRGAGLVSGTTGLSGAQHAALQDAGARIGVLWSANFSLGVALLEELVERAAGALAGWDCDIVEMHHTRKLDAPSGTARSEEHTSELQSLMRISYAVFCLKKKKKAYNTH